MSALHHSRQNILFCFHSYLHKFILLLNVLLLFCVGVSQAHAVEIGISVSETTVHLDQVIALAVTLGCSGCSTDSFLRAVFFPPDTTHYFGYTLNQSGVWISSASDKTQFFQILVADIPEGGTWSGVLKAKLDPESSYYSGPGSYLLKVIRYTPSGSKSAESASQTILVVAPSNTPTPSTHPTITPEPTASPSPQPNTPTAPLPTSTKKPSTPTSLPTNKVTLPTVTTFLASAPPSTPTDAPTPDPISPSITSIPLLSQPEVLAVSTESRPKTMGGQKYLGVGIVVLGVGFLIYSGLLYWKISHHDSS